MEQCLKGTTKVTLEENGLIFYHSVEIMSIIMSYVVIYLQNVRKNDFMAAILYVVQKTSLSV